jgi:cobalt/nickel transport system permease protein
VRKIVLFGLGAALLLAIAVAPFASASPDGLEKVAIDQGLAGTATDHELAGSPLADYAVDGVADERATVSLAGVAGVLASFVLATGAVTLARRAGAGRTRGRP